MKVITYNKTYDAISTEEMYQGYCSAQDKKGYISSFITKQSQNGINSREDFFSLLISEAIQQGDTALVREVLNDIEKESYLSIPSILTSVNKIQLSPLSYSLLFDDDGKIKNILKVFLSNKDFPQKATLTKESFSSLKDTIGYQGESYEECINDLIRPICINDQVNILGEFGHSIDQLA